MNSQIKILRDLLIRAVQRKPYAGLLFSGGLDTSVLAAINPKVVAVTVSLGTDTEDVYYSGVVSQALNLKQVLRKVDIDEALEAVPEVIRILRSFDPAIPNDLAVYFGLKKAKELGISRIATGDASDELFGGYSFMCEIDDLEGYIRRITQTMAYSSNEIGEFLGIEVIQPFTDKEVVDFALTVPKELKIRKDNGAIWGKWILRKAFEDALPKEIIWQNKRPLECGSGMSRLRQIISDRISDEEFREGPASIKFISKEHFYYYKIYREVVGEIPKPKDGEKTCLGCAAGIKSSDFHCKICGNILDWRL